MLCYFYWIDENLLIILTLYLDMIGGRAIHLISSLPMHPHEGGVTPQMTQPQMTPSPQTTYEHPNWHRPTICSLMIAKQNSLDAFLTLKHPRMPWRMQNINTAKTTLQEELIFVCFLVKGDCNNQNCYILFYLFPILMC